jgi:hypothetical protein
MYQIIQTGRESERGGKGEGENSKYGGKWSRIKE